mmetsp:Transcript_32314/g.95206  ORF Transcript_32314/g.95206 Transcript_32314/m.95206 type:complete len:442 (+) Transcript_32314:1449-2774(+)
MAYRYDGLGGSTAAGAGAGAATSAVIVQTPVLSDLTLRLVLAVLPPVEVGRAELVCRRWRRDIREGSDLWRAAATNACASESVVDSLVAAAKARARTRAQAEAGEDGQEAAAGTAAVSDNGASLYRSVAIGLVARLPPVQQPEPLPAPRLRIEDLVLVFQVHRLLDGGNGEAGDDDGDEDDGDEAEYEVVASYCITDLSGLFAKNDQVQLLLDGDATSGAAPFFFDGDNPMAPGNTVSLQHLDPIQEASCEGVDNLFVSCRFFRTDGGQLRQVCVIGTASNGECWPGHGAFAPNVAAREESMAHYWEFPSNQIPRLAPGTGQAEIARRMLSLRQCNKIYFFPEIEFSPLPVGILPSPNAGWGRTLWQHHQRDHPSASDVIAWSDQDREELAHIDCFRFQVSKLALAFHAEGEEEHRGDAIQVDRELSANDKLLFFEGFDWQ